MFQSHRYLKKNYENSKLVIKSSDLKKRQHNDKKKKKKRIKTKRQTMSDQTLILS